jgi:serine/threonine protein phosphatase PrpC
MGKAVVKTRLSFAGASDPGRVRTNNEDAFHMDGERGIFLVVDGIGGQNAGEKAAEIAVARVRARLERQTGTAEQRVREAIAMANNEILRASRDNPEWEGMACVLTLAVLENGSAVVGHVGDSRLYHLRRGEIRKITHDHSPVGEREDRKELSEAEAMRHPRRNEVFRDVGSEPHEPDDSDFIEVTRIPFEADGALLLCSDGLSDLVPSADIRRIVEQNAGHPEAAVQELIDAANRAGGKDNVSVIVVEGEQFAAPKAVMEDPRRGNPLSARPAWFFYGLVLALAGAWFSRPLWVPKPVVIAPRVLKAGSGEPFGTIAEALAKARPGDTVEVAVGEYREQVKMRNGVDLRSGEPGGAILRAAPMTAGPAVVADDVTGARISGFRILADPKMPLSEGIVLNNSKVTVEDMEVSGAGLGIEIRGAAGPVLRGNSVHDCAAEGILIVGPSRPWISHNAIRRNKGAGVAAREGARPYLVDNVFEKNALELPAELPMAEVKARNFILDAAVPPRSSLPPRSAAPPHRPAAPRAPAPEGTKQ